MPFNDDLNAALRYTTDTINSLLTELQKPEYNAHRWGDPAPETGLRGILADAIEEHIGRTTDPSEQHSLQKQATLLRTPNQHVLVADGKVRPAKFNINPTENALQTASDWATENGLEHTLPIIHILDNRNRDYFRSVDMDDPEGYRQTIPKGHLRVVNEDQSGTDTHSHEDVHYSDLGNHLADLMDHSVNDYDDPDGINRNWDEFAGHIKTLRNAPYEEVDLGHSSERDNGFGYDDPNASKY